MSWLIMWFPQILMPGMSGMSSGSLKREAVLKSASPDTTGAISAGISAGSNWPSESMLTIRSAPCSSPYASAE